MPSGAIIISGSCSACFPVPMPATVRVEDNTIFHIGDKIIHFKWEMNRECDVNDYIYVIIGFPKNTETEEELISYRSVSYPEKEWARPKEVFLSRVDTAKYPDINQTYRFVKLSN